MIENSAQAESAQWFAMSHWLPGIPPPPPQAVGVWAGRQGSQKKPGDSAWLHAISRSLCLPAFRAEDHRHQGREGGGKGIMQKAVRMERVLFAIEEVSFV